VRSEKVEAFTIAQLFIRWVLIGSSCFLTFTLLFSRFLLNADWYIISQWGAVFALVVATVGSVLIWWRKGGQPTYWEIGILALLVFIGFRTWFVMLAGITEELWTLEAFYMALMGFANGILAHGSYRLFYGLTEKIIPL
jgi:hypothetical protein